MLGKLDTAVCYSRQKRSRSSGIVRRRRLKAVLECGSAPLCSIMLCTTSSLVVANMELRTLPKITTQHYRRHVVDYGVILDAERLIGVIVS
jgi:hypothetical protein